MGKIRGKLSRGACFLCLVVLTASCGGGGKAFDPFPEQPVGLPPVDATVFLVGDAGLATVNDPVIQQLTSLVAEAAQETETVVVYLGDNVYSSGLHAPTDPEYPVETSYLKAQASVVEGTNARAIFVPGNHDWGYTDERGIEQIKRQAGYIDSLAAAGALVDFQPPAGCPGPTSVNVGTRVLLLLLETDLWLRADEPLETCTNRSTGAAIEALERALWENARDENRYAVVLAHHPLETFGSHGGYATAQEELFPATKLWEPLVIPLPFVYPYLKSRGTNPQDLSSPEYQRLQNDLRTVFRVFPDHPLIYGSGHDHNLQVIEGAERHGAQWLLISGSASKLTAVGDGALFAAGAQHGENGFMRLVFFSDGSVLLTVFTDGTTDCPNGAGACDGEANVRYWRWLTEQKPPEATADTG